MVKDVPQSITCGRYAAETAMSKVKCRNNEWRWCSAYYLYSAYFWHYYWAEYDQLFGPNRIRIEYLVQP